MTHVACPDCRLRFAADTAAYLVACPCCGELLLTQCRPGDVLGYQLYRPADVPTDAARSFAEAIAVAMPTPDVAIPTPDQQRERP